MERNPHLSSPDKARDVKKKESETRARRSWLAAASLTPSSQGSSALLVSGADALLSSSPAPSAPGTGGHFAGRDINLFLRPLLVSLGRPIHCLLDMLTG